MDEDVGMTENEGVRQVSNLFYLTHTLYNRLETWSVERAPSDSQVRNLVYLAPGVLTAAKATTAAAAV